MQVTATEIAFRNYTDNCIDKEEFSLRESKVKDQRIVLRIL